MATALALFLLSLAVTLAATRPNRERRDS